MADRKRKIIDDNPFAKTTGEQPGQDQDRFDLDKGPTKATGLGLRAGELEAVEAIARELEITKNALMRWAIRYVLKEYLAGRLDIQRFIRTPPEPKKTIDMP